MTSQVYGDFEYDGLKLSRHHMTPALPDHLQTLEFKEDDVLLATFPKQGVVYVLKWYIHNAH